MRPIVHIMIIICLGLLMAACAKPLRQQTPEAIAVEQTLETFWMALRAEDQTALDRQLATDATLIKMAERDSRAEVPLTVALMRPEYRFLLAAAAQERLVKFEQPAPQRASVETFLNVTRQQEIKRGRIHWDLVRDDGMWRLQRIKTAIWTFPKPPGGSGP